MVAAVEIIDRKSQPAGQQYHDSGNDFAGGRNVFLEDVHDAPDCAGDTDQPNDSSDHNFKVLEFSKTFFVRIRRAGRPRRSETIPAPERRRSTAKGRGSRRSRGSRRAYSARVPHRPASRPATGPCCAENGRRGS